MTAAVLRFPCFVKSSSQLNIPQNKAQKTLPRNGDRRIFDRGIKIPHKIILVVATRAEQNMSDPMVFITWKF